MFSLTSIELVVVLSHDSLLLLQTFGFFWVQIFMFCDRNELVFLESSWKLIIKYFTDRKDFLLACKNGNAFAGLQFDNHFYQVSILLKSHLYYYKMFQKFE